MSYVYMLYPKKPRYTVKRLVLFVLGVALAVTMFTGIFWYWLGMLLSWVIVPYNPLVK